MSLSTLKIEVEEVDEDRLTATIDLATDSDAFMIQAIFLIIRAHCFKHDITSADFIEALQALNMSAGVQEPDTKALH